MGRIVEEKRPYMHAVGHCSRCDTTVEPRLSKQWFVKVESLAKAAGDAVRDGRVKIEPEELAPRYFDWVDNLNDWCISRQLWWGHRIPVWYGPNGEVVVVGPGESAPAGYTQDPDVLDTWFSSALWPFSTLGWPNETADVKKFYPTSVLVTGYDILFFWVARMMMFGLFAMDGVAPFHTIVLHGLVRDQFGKKMSKSRGNVVDPLEFIDKYGADALRFTLARGSNPGKDQALAEDWIAGSRNFATKLWNATRFAMMNGATVEGPLPPVESLSAIDKWILSRLSETTTEYTALLESYEFARACEVIYHFAWDDLCDWYLELSKEAFASGNAAASQRVLGHVLDSLFRLLHPVMPFITEELWHQLENRPAGEDICAQSYPAQIPSDQALIQQVESIKEVITKIREIRNQNQIKPKDPLEVCIQSSSSARQLFELPGAREMMEKMAVLSSLEFVETEPSNAKSFISGTDQYYVILNKQIDVEAERAKLTEELTYQQGFAASVEKKLSNEKFVSGAPAQVVENERKKLADANARIAMLEESLRKL
jgi:valyl-tRNA synthetase